MKAWFAGLTALGLGALELGACSALPPVVSRTSATSPNPRAPVTQAPAAGAPAAGASVGQTSGGVSSTILPGRPPAAPALSTAERPLRPGDVSLDYPGVDVQAVAHAVLGDILGVPYSVPPDIHTPITLAPSRPIARADVPRALELALAPAGLALTPQPGGGYAILPNAQARAVAPVGGSSTTPGFASEVIPLQFVNADEMRKLIEPVIPGVVVSTDTASNSLTIAGASGQRASAHDLVRQFDVNWLRGTSFALFVPHRTDARLIVPELDKVLNADGAPTKNLVRLIAMDRLNGILAVSTQPQYLEDTRRWVEILDREGENNERRLFVYRVQNGRSSDLAKTLINAFGGGGSANRMGGGGVGTDGMRSDSAIAGGSGSLGISTFQPPGSGTGSGALNGAGSVGGASLAAGPGGASAGLASSTTPSTPDTGSAGGGGGPTTGDVQADGFHAKITSDEVNNAVVVYSTPRDYAVVEDALRKLDIAPYQVEIEAAIVEVTLTDQLRFGVQGLFNNNVNFSAGLTEGTTAAVAQAFPGFSALYSARTVSAALNALESLTKVNVVSAPKLLVLNNQTASIQVGNEVPILTGSATNVVTSNAAVVNSVDYRDTGIILKVTPRVNSSGFVLMDLAQEVSDVVASGSAATIDSPTFSNRKIATSVAIQDGEVIALGGLIRDNRTDIKTGLPVLSRIPLLGPLLFGNINNDDERTELIVLLQPKVVKNVEDARAVTLELRDKLQSLRALLPDGKAP